MQTPDNPIMDSSEEEAEDSDEDWCAGNEDAKDSVEESSEDEAEESEDEVEESEDEAEESAEESECDTSQDEEQRDTGFTKGNSEENVQKIQRDSENTQPRKRRRCAKIDGK